MTADGDTVCIETAHDFLEHSSFKKKREFIGETTLMLSLSHSSKSTFSDSTLLYIFFLNATWENSCGIVLWKRPQIPSPCGGNNLIMLCVKQ